MADQNAAPNPYQAPPPVGPLNPHDEKQFALLSHLLSIFFGFVPALILFILYRDRGPFVRNHVVTEWNFQLTLLIVQAVFGIGGIATASIGFATSHHGDGGPSVVLFFMGYFAILAVNIVRIIFCIIASVAANRGRFYRYPIAFRFVRE